VFTEQVVAMRTWMQEHGQQNKPLILSEYSLLYAYVIDPDGCYLQDEYDFCFTPDRVRNFMTRSFNYLDSASDPALGYPADGNRLVQRWLWFWMFSPDPLFPGYVSNLLTDSQTALTTVGELFQSSVADPVRHPSYVNLRPDPVPPLSAIASSGVATANITVSVFNIGTAPTASPFTVTFYSDSGDFIGSAVVAPGLPGCEGRRVTATVSWPDLPVGSHQFSAWVDSGKSVVESNEDDNVVSGYVTICPCNARLPLVLSP